MNIKGLLFDLDGVIVDTSKYHYIAWKEIADELGIKFTLKDNERLKGVSRDRSFEIILEIGDKEIGKKLQEEYCTRKNEIYLNYIRKMTENEILPGIKEFITDAKKKGYLIALGSASKNSRLILENMKLLKFFDAIIDGTKVSKAKPDPEVFLKGASELGIGPEQCIVFEDAEAGIEAAHRGKMAAVGIGRKEILREADIVLPGFKQINIDYIMNQLSDVIKRRNMKQVFNPYLPLNEYVPDGEPHLFDGRVYIYGSHDKARGTKYCEGHYVTWSAPENDLTDWRYEGVIYRRTQDPSNANDSMQLWAPDVTQGADRKYYLYYCLSFYPEIGVAISDSPAGPFEFYGHVKYPEHINGGRTLREFMPFDPAVLTDDDGRVYLYYGFAPAEEKEMILPDPDDVEVPEEMTKRLTEIKKIEFGENGMAVELETDMITVKDIPKPCIPGGHHTKGTGFEGHGYFEAPSIRRIGEKYYLVYSSHKSHELCYAVSDKPMEGYIYGGTIVSNGDIGMNGQQYPTNILGNNHGGMVKANGQWYIFYHRQTNGSEFSRQGCAEKIEIDKDGNIMQVEITSCGLNDGPLVGEGEYPSAIACHITCPELLNIIDYQNPLMQKQTRITENMQGEQYITDIHDGSLVGYKYFECSDLKHIGVVMRGEFEGEILITSDEFWISYYCLHHFQFSKKRMDCIRYIVVVKL